MRANARDIAIAILAAAVCSVGAFLVDAQQKTTVPRSLDAMALNADVVTKTDGASVSRVPPQTQRVTRILDGDTVELLSGERVRLIGIDAPETGNCFAQEATEALQLLVLGTDVRLDRDVSERDKYGRLLAYLYTDDVFVNMRLVMQGDAVAFPYPPDTAHAGEFSLAEQEARAAHVGLWKKCGGLNRGPMQRQEATGPNGCTIKGNISPSGERIYHLPGCGSYAKTIVNASAGERWFCAEQEAKDAGWRKAGNC